MKKQEPYNPRIACISLLQHFAKTPAPVNEMLHEFMEQHSFSEADKQLLNALLMGIIRNLSLLDAVINDLVSRKTKRFLKTFLECAIFQTLFFNKIPSYAIIAETLKAADYFNLASSPKKFLRATLSNFYKNATKYDLSATFVQNLPLDKRYSVPEWIISEWKQILNQHELISCLRSSVTDPPIWVIPVQEKICISNTISELEVNHIDFARPSPDILQFQKWNPLLKKYLVEGKAYVQCPHQFNAVSLCPANKNEVILEIGAAPGGKTVFLNRLVSKGRVISIEKNPQRFSLLTQRVRQMELRQVTPLLQNLFDPFPSGIPDLFDHIVLDAPCSNLGELSRKPDVRWKITKENIDELHKIQQAMVECAWKKLKENGTLLYLTCTLTKQENYEIRDFITGSLKGKLEKEILTVPVPSNPAGGYACLVKKNLG